MAADITDESQAIDDSQLHGEVLTSALAIGLRSVHNIWDASTYERARLEVFRIIEVVTDGELGMGDFLKLRLDEYLNAWSDAEAAEGGNMPWDDVASRVLSNIGVARSAQGDAPVINPSVTMAVSQILIKLPGMFWKRVDEKLKLS